MNSDHWKEVSRLNRLALNQAAAKLLPPNWVSETGLHVLALALWGAQEQGIYPELDETVGKLGQADPETAMRLVTESPDGGEVLHPDALDNLSPEDGASLILEAISDRIYG